MVDRSDKMGGGYTSAPLKDLYDQAGNKVTSEILGAIDLQLHWDARKKRPVWRQLTAPKAILHSHGSLLTLTLTPPAGDRRHEGLCHREARHQPAQDLQAEPERPLEVPDQLLGPRWWHRWCGA